MSTLKGSHKIPGRRFMTNDPTPADLLDVAEAAARAAGRHALDHLARRQEADARSRHDIKLVLDRECQAVATGVVEQRFPGHHVMGEEAGQLAGGAGYQWVIDPIDGTVNFSRGLPYWCSSVAVQQDGETVAGAVFAPELDTCYTATIGGPACRNGRPIRVSDASQLDHAMILVNSAGYSGPDDPRARALLHLLPAVGKVRILGAAALDLCLVAAGESDGLLEYGLSLWDYAAGALIVERAGGRFETRVPDHGCRLCLASNGRLHHALNAFALP